MTSSNPYHCTIPKHNLNHIQTPSTCKVPYIFELTKSILKEYWLRFQHYCSTSFNFSRNIRSAILTILNTILKNPYRSHSLEKPLKQVSRLSLLTQKKSEPKHWNGSWAFLVSVRWLTMLLRMYWDQERSMRLKKVHIFSSSCSGFQSGTYFIWKIMNSHRIFK